MKKGLLVVISGFSGSGKGTLMKELLARFDNYSLSISLTTRKPREGEREGKDYFFVTKEEFEKRIRDDSLIEYAAYVGNYYGTPKDYVLSQMEKGKDVILEIEIQGALKIKQKFPETILIFVTPPDSETLKKRLLKRGTEDDDQIRKRLHRAAEESRWMDAYDYLIVNDDLDTAVTELHSLIDSQHRKTMMNMDFVKKIQDDLNEHYLKED
jgi:guanylate kinase